jgi:para-nitrobenzyl esterase
VTQAVRASVDRPLTEASIDELLAATVAGIRANMHLHTHYAPVGMSGQSSSKSAGEKEPKDVLLGWTKDDGSCFAAMFAAPPGTNPPKITYSDQISIDLTSKLFKQPSINLAERWRKEGHPVTTFEHNWRPDGFDLGATHCVDLPLVFGDYEAWSKSPVHGTVSPEEWDRRGELVRQAWGRFAKDGTVPSSLEGVATNPM